MKISFLVIIKVTIQIHIYRKDEVTNIISSITRKKHTRDHTEHSDLDHGDLMKSKNSYSSLPV